MEGFSREKLKRIRLRLGLSQRAVPGVAQDTLSALESGRREPRPSTLRRLAEAYGVEVADFFEDPAAPPTAPREDLDIGRLIQEIASAEQPKTPTDWEAVDEQVERVLVSFPKERLEEVRPELAERARRLNGLSLADFQDRARVDALWSAWEELRAVNRALCVLDRVLAEA
ncbi:MAG: helix-turn-helix domain-containing protein [Actinomycetota bacterium]|nr:helix-turn-helix domain-containing protein [Actinomycetota bacterium]